jgi:hypothetical protein
MIAAMRTHDTQPGRLFIVRINDAGEAGLLRGQVRDGVTGAYRAFTTWPELTAFLSDQLTNRSPAEEDKP